MKTDRKRIESCVTPAGEFIYGIHKPSYTVINLRQDSTTDILGIDQQNEQVKNSRNFPRTDLTVQTADWIFEISNPLPFKGRTFINKKWADSAAADPGKIHIPAPQDVSLTKVLTETGTDPELLKKLPAPLLLALATSSTDRDDLTKLARLSCDIIDTGGGQLRLGYKRSAEGAQRAIIHDHPLFEAVANNPYLPEGYRIAMVIRPGAQGDSEIVGDWPADGKSHVYEYLRRNSYIAGGHYAANMAEDAVRYAIANLSPEDMHGLRHLYYQRIFVNLAQLLEIDTPVVSKVLTGDQLETLRQQIQTKRNSSNRADGYATLWGWNFGFDFAPSLYRLHASHQQIHQQYALVPNQIQAFNRGTSRGVGELSAYSSGDLVAEVIDHYQSHYQSDFFSDYLKAIRSNRRMDERQELDADLVVWSDKRSLLFVPKAQTSQWELQLMTLPADNGRLCGNIVECDQQQRESIDTGILKAQQALAGLGAKMVTSIEYSKRLEKENGSNQPLIYAFLPRLPESPGAFSEAQLRFINGHYPEDFASACRAALG